MDKLSSSIKGLACELRVSEKLLSLGYSVFKDINSHSRIDLLIRCEDDKFVKIQVKKIETYRKSSRIVGKTFKILNMGHKNPYSKHDLDFFIGVDDDKFYIVPYEIAYKDNLRRQDFYLTRQFFEAWELLPKPFEVIKEVTESNQEEMLFVA